MVGLESSMVNRKLRLRQRGFQVSEYVTDNTLHRVQVFDAEGRFLAKWGSLGTGDGQFGYPVRITADESGNAYVTDADNNRVQVFAPV